MRTLAIALGMLGLLAVPATAAAQTCPTGQLYCSGGWCCPAMADGGTNVCCNGNPESSGCTTTGYCGTSSSGDGGASQSDGGAPSCPTGDFYCSAGWCCPPGQGGRSDVCCNSNPMANGCTSNGNCSTSAGGSSGGSGSSSGGVATPPPGCGTNQTFNSVACGGGIYCPANSTCQQGGSCQCAQGYVAANCMGALCNGTCSAPSYFCAPASDFGGSSGGASSGGTGSSSGGSGGGSKSGCDASGSDPGSSAPWLALLAGASALALWRGRRTVRG